MPETPTPQDPSVQEIQEVQEEAQEAQIQDLLSNIYQEESHTYKIKTSTIANFYLAVYAYQAISLIQRELPTIQSENTIESLDRAKYHLLPRLETVIQQASEAIAFAIANDIVYELTEVHTVSPNDPKIYSTLLDNELSGIVEEFRTATGSNKTINEQDPYETPEPLTWKLNQLITAISDAYQEQDHESFKQGLAELSQLASAIFFTQDTNWRSLVKNLASYASTGEEEFNKSITYTDNLINSSHGNGSILEHITVNPINAQQFLDIKASGNDRIVAKAADLSLFSTVRRHSRIVPLEVFAPQRQKSDET